MLTNQEIFDKSVGHLLKQGIKSEVYTKGQVVLCAYRSTDGLKCAIGALIDDAHYTPQFEGESVFNPEVRAALDKSGVTYVFEGQTADLLAALQDMHDGEDESLWLQEALLIAKSFDLDHSAVQKLADQLNA